MDFRIDVVFVGVVLFGRLACQSAQLISFLVRGAQCPNWLKMCNARKMYLTIFKLTRSSQIHHPYHFYMYSRGSNSEHSNSEFIRKRNVSKFRFQIVRFSIHHLKTESFKMAALA